MNNNEEFSLEQSEKLIANLKSGAPSEFEQLRSTLSLLAHVPELPPTSIPPVLPSSISQPVPLLPVKSSKPRRTVVTSIMVTGLFASASLAAAAVTGIGPAAIVNVGHEAAKFVKGVVGGVAHVVTGHPSDATQNQVASPQVPLAIPTPTSASAEENNQEENNQSDSEKFALIIPPLSNLFPPVSTESNSHENDSQKPNSSHETQGPNVEDSPLAIPEGNKEPTNNQTNNEDQNQPSSHPSEKPKPEPSAEHSAEQSNEPSAEPTIQPTPEPSAEPTDSEN